MPPRKKPPKKDPDKLTVEIDWKRAKRVRFKGITAPVLKSSDYVQIILIQKIEPDDEQTT